MPRFAWDPNTDLLHAIVDTIRDEHGDRGELAAGVLSRDGELDSVTGVGTFQPGTFVPITAGSFLYARGGELRSWPGDAVLANIPYSLAQGGLQRLYGDYFLWYGQESEGYRLGVYDLQGDSVASLVLSTPINRLLIDPGSPRILLLTQMNNRLHVRLLNQQLEESIEKVTPIAPPPGITMARPEATVVGDSLFVVWTGTNSVEGRQEVYLTRVRIPEVPEIPVDTTGSDTTASYVIRESQRDGVGSGWEMDSFPEEIRVTPNPAQSTISMQIEPKKSEDIEISIMNSRGVLVQTVRRRGKSGICLIEIDVASLPQGTYMIYAECGEQRFFGEVVVVQ